MKLLFDFATIVIFDQIKEHPSWSRSVTYKPVSDDRIAYVREGYDHIIYEFTDSVFDFECKLQRKEWMKMVIEKEDWIV